MAGDLDALAGAWEITERLTAGVDSREPDDDAKFMWFRPKVILSGDAWAAWEMPYLAQSGLSFGEIDVTRADLHEPWLQRGIFDVTNDILRLCMAGEPSNPRPRSFRSTSDNGCVLYVARRSNEPLPE